MDLLFKSFFSFFMVSKAMSILHLLVYHHVEGNNECLGFVKHFLLSKDISYMLLDDPHNVSMKWVQLIVAQGLDSR